MLRKNTFSGSIFIILVVFFLASAAGCSRFAAPNAKLDKSLYSPEGTIAAEGKYIIGVRDELRIAVWRCPELERTVEVRPEDGRITYPLIGDIKAAGLTPKELAQKISNELAHYVKEPRVAVGVQKFGDKKVFVFGQVLRRGTFQLERGDRIVDLVSRAGGFTENAVISTTYVIRGGYEESRIIRVNLARLMHKGDLSQNVYLAEGDIVYVPVSEFENINQALRKLFPTLFFAEKLADTQEDIMDGHYDWHAVWQKMAGQK
jgi:polysaccharide export outer membrane protein